MQSQICLGIDTGGTYTDAVLYSEGQGIVATAKALTTRHDLAIGIAGAVEAVLGQSGVDAGGIGLVSLSTTLATNALVEGQGGRVALVMIGFAPADLERDGLAVALGQDPVIFLAGGHDVHGRETPLELAPLEARLAELGKEVTAVAVAGYFAVRNPAHENAVRNCVRVSTGLPVTCSHELTSQLGGPRRALTTLLNARLIPMITRLIAASEACLAARGISAPLMVVRGDGALISSAEALTRPIETILSGPAAGLVGARHLTGLENAVICDIGGTTTDVAILDAGRPRIDREGASVGPYRTMVEAVAMHSFGLGGDSEVGLSPEGPVRLVLGPRRLIPLSLAAHLYPQSVMEPLERQLRAPHAGRLDGRFALAVGLSDHHAVGLTAQEQELYKIVTRLPVPLDRLIDGNSRLAALDRLVARGLVQLAGFTPSDAMHVLGRQNQWDVPAARLGALLFARRRDGTGVPLAETADEISRLVSESMTRQGCNCILVALFAGESAGGAAWAASPLVERALRGETGIVRFSLALDRPLVSLGASAPVHHPAIAARLGAKSVIPAHADVANALGAVVGQVREEAVVFVTEEEDGVLAVNGAGRHHRLTDRAAAFELARRIADEYALELALRSGAASPLLRRSEEIVAPLIEGVEKLVEARFSAVAAGRPRIASG